MRLSYEAFGPYALKASHGVKDWHLSDFLGILRIDIRLRIVRVEQSFGSPSIRSTSCACLPEMSAVAHVKSAQNFSSWTSKVPQILALRAVILG